QNLARHARNGRSFRERTIDVGPLFHLATSCKSWPIQSILLALAYLTFAASFNRSISWAWRSLKSSSHSLHDQSPDSWGMGQRLGFAIYGCPQISHFSGIPACNPQISLSASSKLSDIRCVLLPSVDNVSRRLLAAFFASIPNVILGP